MIRFEELSPLDKALITKLYNDPDLSKQAAQEALAAQFGVTTRSIRNWAKKIGLRNEYESDQPAKILIYDFETAQIPSKVWWTGKQYVNYKQLKGEPRVITVAWKWLGEDSVHHLTWSKDKSDEDLIKTFAPVFNSADLVVGHNVVNFDNRLLRAQAAKYDVRLDPFIRVYDTMKRGKKLFRLPSYSMDYMCKYFKVPMQKQSHEGIVMWDEIEDDGEHAAEYLKKMVDYNVGDILANEHLYLKVLAYDERPGLHAGVLAGGEKHTCPTCGGDNVEYVRHTTTPAGTIQRIMLCKDDGTYFKISNRTYLNWYR